MLLWMKNYKYLLIIYFLNQNKIVFNNDYLKDLLFEFSYLKMSELMTFL